MWRLSAALLVLGGALAASAESALRFDPPTAFGATTADVLDEVGTHVGSARFEATEGPDGSVRLRSRTRLESGQGSDLEAVLAPAEKGGQLKLISEHSRTFRAGGALAVEAQIDHVASRVRCTGSASEGGELALGANEHVANVPVQLLLWPLAMGQRSELEVDVAVCRGKPRVMTMHAERKRARAWPGRSGVVEIEYGPTGWIGALAGLIAPRASFWFDPSEPSPWLAHRMPLEPGGAPMIVVREGVKLAPSLLSSRSP